MGEIRGAIQRIDVPAVFRGTLVTATLFANDRMAREVGTQTLDDQRFRGSIGRRHQVVLALVLKADLAFGVLGENRARFTSDLHGGFEIGGHLCF